MKQHEHKLQGRTRQIERVGCLGVVIGALLFNAVVQAEEIQQLEALGVVNGNMTARNAQVDITVFLSGQPLFQVTDLTETKTLAALTIEQAHLVSRDGNIFRIQQSFTLPNGMQGTLLLPVQVLVDGNPVTVTVTEDSFGLRVVLPDTMSTVDVMPVGAVQLTVPAEYRGDLMTQLRISGEPLPTNE